MAADAMARCGHNNVRVPGVDLEETPASLSQYIEIEITRWKYVDEHRLVGVYPLWYSCEVTCFQVPYALNHRGWATHTYVNKWPVAKP